MQNNLDKSLNKLAVYLISVTIVLSPLYVIRWSYLSVFPTTFLEMLISITAITWAVVKTRQKTRLPQARLIGDFALPIGLIIISAVVSVFISNDQWGSLGIFRAYFLEPILLAYLVIDTACNKDADLGISGLINRKLRRKHKSKTAMLYRQSMISAAVWLSVIGISQHFWHWPIVTDHQFDRAHAVFNNGNSLALFLGPVAVVLFADLISKFNAAKYLLWLKNNRVDIVALLIIVTTMLLTKSLGGVVSLSITFLAIVIFKHFSFLQARVKYIVPAGLALFLVFLTQISSITPKTTNPWERSYGTSVVRLCVWEGAWNLVKQNPVFGVGLRGFQEEYSKKYFTCDAEPLVYPHNIFLNFWSELGFVGLSGVLGIIYLALRTPLSIYSFTFLYIFLHGLVDVPYFKNDLALMFWILLSLHIVDLRKQR